MKNIYDKYNKEKTEIKTNRLYSKAKELVFFKYFFNYLYKVTKKRNKKKVFSTNRNSIKLPCDLRNFTYANSG